MAETQYDTAFYDQHVAGSLSSARVILPILTEYYHPRSVVDVGCGRGTWLRAAIDCGMEDALGIDGDYVDTGSLLIEPSRFLATDLADRFDVGRRFDLAISVEVAEHLPFHRSETFVADLVKLSQCVLFSAALPYQGGTNHVNEQWLEFWAIFFRRHGYVACDLFRSRIWSDKRVEFWYSQNLVIFCKQELAEIFPKETLADARPLSFPHPVTLLANAARHRPLASEARDLETSDYQSLLEAYTAGETTQPILKTTVKDAAGEPGVPLFPTARMRIMDAAELARLYAELNRSQCELLSHASEIDRLSREIAARTAEVDQLSGALRQREEEVAARTADIDQLSSTLRQREGEIAARTADIDQLSGTLRQREGEIAARTTDIDQLSGTLRQREGEIAARTADIDQLSSTLRQREGEIAARTADIDRLSIALRQHEAEIAARTADIDQLSGTLRQREGEIAARTADIDQLSGALRQRDGEIENLQADRTAREAEIGRLKAELRIRAGETGKLSDDLAARDRLHEQLSARLDSREEEIQRLMNQVATDAAENSRLSSDYRALRDRFDSVTSEKKESEEEVRRLTAGLKEARAETARLTQESADRDRGVRWLNGVLADRNRRLTEIEHSLTWRLTTPVHSFRNFRHWISIKHVRAKWFERLIEPSGLFDPEYYISHNSDVAGADPLVHYISRGAAEGRKPNPLFESSFYLHQYPDVANSGMNPLAHYVAFGATEGRKPCPLFDPKFYFSRNPDLDPATVNPLQHYLRQGAAEWRDPHPLFDSSFYLKWYPEVAQSGLNPLDHYLTLGAAEGRDPNPLFDTSYYLERNPEVAQSGVNPLVHYESIGAAAGRDPNALFDTSFYVERHPEVAQSGLNPLAHYLSAGAAAGLDPHPLFDTSYYFERYPDVSETGMNPLAHYLWIGSREGRDPHPLFDTSFYREKYPDVEATGMDPLAHYLGPGTVEGCDPNPRFDTTGYLEQHPDVAHAGVNPLLHYQAVHGVHENGAVPARTVDDGGGLRSRLRHDFELSGRRLLDDPYHAQPQVTVIIPCFNHCHFLEDAILSGLMSCSLPMEIIVIDDGSTESVELLDVLRARYRFQLLRQGNQGPAAARRLGFERARGEFLQFLDADDLLAPDKIDLQVRELGINEQTDICICEYDLCDSAGANRRMEQPSTIAGFHFTCEDFLLRWERGLTIPIHCVLFRRSALRASDFTNITRAKEDWIFWIHVSARLPRFQFVPAVLATYRIHGKNTFNSREAMGLDFLMASLHVLESGLNTADTFPEASLQHFRSAYLGSIKHEAIVMSQSVPAHDIRLGDLQRRVDDLEHSLSWRITRPLRAVGSLVLKLRR